jgi:hypothetical protein
MIKSYKDLISISPDIIKRINGPLGDPLENPVYLSSTLPWMRIEEMSDNFTTLSGKPLIFNKSQLSDSMGQYAYRGDMSLQSINVLLEGPQQTISKTIVRIEIIVHHPRATELIKPLLVPGTNLRVDFGWTDGYFDSNAIDGSTISNDFHSGRSFSVQCSVVSMNVRMNADLTYNVTLECYDIGNHVLNDANIDLVDPSFFNDLLPYAVAGKTQTLSDLDPTVSMDETTGVATNPELYFYKLGDIIKQCGLYAFRNTPAGHRPNSVTVIGGAGGGDMEQSLYNFIFGPLNKNAIKATEASTALIAADETGFSLGGKPTNPEELHSEKIGGIFFAGGNLTIENILISGDQLLRFRSAPKDVKSLRDLMEELLNYVDNQMNRIISLEVFCSLDGHTFYIFDTREADEIENDDGRVLTLTLGAKNSIVKNIGLNLSIDGGADFAVAYSGIHGTTTLYAIPRWFIEKRLQWFKDKGRNLFVPQTGTKDWDLVLNSIKMDTGDSGPLIVSVVPQREDSSDVDDKAFQSIIQNWGTAGKSNSAAFNTYLDYLPLKGTLTLRGLSGLYPGCRIKLKNTGFSNWEKVVFYIISVEHTINTINGWETVIDLIPTSSGHDKMLATG